MIHNLDGIHIKGVQYSTVLYYYNIYKKMQPFLQYTVLYFTVSTDHDIFESHATPPGSARSLGPGAVHHGSVHWGGHHAHAGQDRRARAQEFSFVG
jgi:hypothetical protein